LEGWNVRESPTVLEWQAEARLEAVRTKVLRLLEVRLQAPAPADVAARVTATSDLNVLNRWFDAAATTPTYDEFRRHLGEVS
jgi:hypothetical protein